MIEGGVWVAVFGEASVKALRFASVPAGRPWWVGLDPVSVAVSGPDLGGSPGGGGAVAVGSSGGAEGDQGGFDARPGQVAPEEVPQLDAGETGSAGGESGVDLLGDGVGGG